MYYFFIFYVVVILGERYYITFAVYGMSRPSSVCDVGAPYTQTVELFGDTLHLLVLIAYGPLTPISSHANFRC